MFACTQANRNTLLISPLPPPSPPLPTPPLPSTPLFPSPLPSSLPLFPFPSPGYGEGLETGPSRPYLDLLLCADDSKVWVMHVRSRYHVVLHLIWIWDWNSRVVEDEYRDHRSSVKKSIVLAFGGRWGGKGETIF